MISGAALSGACSGANDPDSQIRDLKRQLEAVRYENDLAALMAEYDKHVPLPDYGSRLTLQLEAESDIINPKKVLYEEIFGNGRTREETRSDFEQRNRAEGRTIYEGEQIAYGYRPTQRESAQQNARQIQEELNLLNIEGTIIDGDMYWNHNGFSGIRSVPEAATVGKQHIFISNNVTLPAKNVAGHEAFHLWGKTNARENYVDVLVSNIQFESEDFNYYQSVIAEEYFENHKDIDITDPRQASLLMEEIMAYISGDIHEGVNDDLLRPMFRDYDAIREAWRKLIRQE